MQIDDATPHAGPDSEYLWCRDGTLARAREDRLAEAVALVALLFSLVVGLVIAMLPVSAMSAVAAEAALEPSDAHIVPAPDAPRVQRAGVDRG
jgi:hypothetical protein